MLKKINQLLKLVGFNLVHAKKAKTHTIKGRKPYTEKELLEAKITGVNCTPSPTTCCADVGKTHYVGDDCSGGHKENIEVGYNIAVGYKSKAVVVNPDAAFVPVDIGPSGPCGGDGVVGIACPNQDNNT